MLSQPASLAHPTSKQEAASPPAAPRPCVVKLALGKTLCRPVGSPLHPAPPPARPARLAHGLYLLAQRASAPLLACSFLHGRHPSPAPASAPSLPLSSTAHPSFAAARSPTYTLPLLSKRYDRSAALSPSHCGPTQPASLLCLGILSLLVPILLCCGPLSIIATTLLSLHQLSLEQAATALLSPLSASLSHLPSLCQPAAPLSRHPKSLLVGPALLVASSQPPFTRAARSSRRPGIVTSPRDSQALIIASRRSSPLLPSPFVFELCPSSPLKPPVPERRFTCRRAQVRSILSRVTSPPRASEPAHAPRRPRRREWI
ncbi:uncharacterized protein PSFLO_05195 [Pseudozyma flocculosa]|uniref:Uncharacterized protein n=1 Tax=Pseudozyma flocculosa TaxID=84751 RepID=A0A5C3F5D6_9BASI|nr:uncharacterized protein PSFLO_05195 [Pseudozyma flocculosa]